MVEDKKRQNDDPPITKKPQGLGSKKTRADDDEPAGPAKEGLYFELSEDASQLDELKAMLEAAETVSDDPSKSLPLLRGIIHECDLVVRMHENDATEAHTDTIPLNCPFWILYGDALFLLGQIEYTERAPEIAEFVREAVERYEKALEMEQSNREALTKKMIASVLLYAFSEEEEFPTDFQNSVETIKDDSELFPVLLNGIVETAMEADDNDRKIYILTAIKPFVPIPGNVNDFAATIKFANTLVESQLESLIDSAESISKELLELETYLCACIAGIDQSTVDEHQLSIGESHLLLGSINEILEAPDKVTKHYKTATGLFTAAQAAGLEMPEGILSFLEENQ